MSRKITIEGKLYVVIESLGFQQSAGVYAWEVRDGETLRIAVSNNRGGPYRFWTPKERGVE